MQGSIQQPSGCFSANPTMGDQNRVIPGYGVPTQNRFAPLNEWVGYSMGIQNDLPQHEQIDWEAAQSKRKRFNTGAGSGEINFSSLSVDDKLSHMLIKLNNLEESNKVMVNISQGLSNVQSRVECIEQRSNKQDIVLNVLAYKSIDIEARSRRRNLLFHGLAERKDENCCELIREFLWNEMQIDSDDFYIERAHRLGSLYRAKQKNITPKRPIIVEFFEFKNTETVMKAAFRLKGTNFSVSRDFPMEIVSARKRLMPVYRTERLIPNNRVSIEYPAKLIVNGKTVADQFPDWYSVLQQDRYQLVKTLNSNNVVQQGVPLLNIQPGMLINHQDMHTSGNCHSFPSQTINSQVEAPSHANLIPENRQPVGSEPMARTYAQVTASAQRNIPPVAASATQATHIPSNIPRYTSAYAGNQQQQQQEQQRNVTQSNVNGSDQRSFNSDRNSRTNGTAPRDQTDYTQL